MTSVRFTIGDAFEGFAEVDGIARLDQDALVMEFEIRDGILGVIRSGLRRVRVPLEDLDSVTYRKGLLGGGRIDVRVRRMGLLELVPTSKAGACRLRVARAERENAASFASLATLRISELQLERLEAERAG